VPLAAPSANAFGKVSPTTAAHVAESLEVPVLDGGPSSVGLESTILGWTGTTFRLLRLGGLAVEEIEKVVGELEKPVHQKSMAPGMLKHHYQPGTRLRFREPGETPRTGRIGLLTLRGRSPGFATTIELSTSGNLEEAAAAFFESLRTLDKAGVDEIWADRLPDTGLGRAINDRLTRACH
jgi:L-threonylcarbamoyladenylate synthase